MERINYFYLHIILQILAAGLNFLLILIYNRMSRGGGGGGVLGKQIQIFTVYSSEEN